MRIVEELLSINEYTRPGRKRPDTLALILHWVENPGQSAGGVWNYWEYEVAKLERWASANYVIGLDGEVLSTVPEDEIAYHVGSDGIDPASGRIYTDWARERFGKYAIDYDRWSPNYCTIGIELCHVNWQGRFTEATLDSARELCGILCHEWKLDPMREIGTHFGVVGCKRCPRWFVERPEEFERFKKEVAGSRMGSSRAVSIVRTTGRTFNGC